MGQAAASRAREVPSLCFIRTNTHIKQDFDVPDLQQICSDSTVQAHHLVSRVSLSLSPARSALVKRVEVQLGKLHILRYEYKIVQRGVLFGMAVSFVYASSMAS